MKKGLYNKVLVSVSSLVFVVLLTVSWSSCRKKDQTCTAIITVTDVGGTALAGATVRLKPDVIPPTGSTINIDTSSTTDGSGKATFQFKLQSILNATVTSGTLVGTGMVKLVPSETVEKTIIAQ